MQTRAPVSTVLSGALAAGVFLLATACASTGVSPRPFPTPPGQPDVEAAPPALPLPGPPAGDGFTVAGTALRLQGTPYRLGGATPEGFDCSGLVQYVYGLYGVALPRLVRDQFDAGRKVVLNDLRPGDLVFFVTEGRAVSHVGIAIGGDRFVHAPNARGVVRVDSLATGYWGEHVAGARRVGN
jgi:cell wall-associated NlpC family hydrolase